MPLIETRSITKIFERGEERIFALLEISLTIEKGEFVAITGPSGSGKSTLMYILGLLDAPTSGSYMLEGIAAASLNDDARAKLRNQKIGFVFQSFHLLPRATALRNVAMPLVYAASYGMRHTAAAMDAAAREALDRVGLSDRLLHRPNELSGGQRQRVAIARALVNKPSIIFADEPTGNLDSKRGEEIVELLKDLNRSGVTIILVTHDPKLARIAARELQMLDGAIEKEVRHAAL